MTKSFFLLQYLQNYSESRDQAQTPLGSFEVLNMNIQKKWQGGWIIFEILRV